MVVVMLIERVMQDAGAERPLHAGECYDLPDGIAAAFIATGTAKMPDTKPDRPPEGRLPAPPATPQGAPENENRGGAPENKARRPGGRE